MSTFKFSSVGENINVVSEREVYKKKTDKKTKSPIGIILPLQKGKRKGESLFKMSFDIEEQIINNFRNLLMTRKGELIGKPNYGSEIFRIINFTNIDNEEIENFLVQEIQQVTDTFFINPDTNEPFVNLNSFEYLKEKSNSDFSDIVKLIINFTVGANIEEKTLILSFKINK